MKELIFATGNASKGKRFSKGLALRGIEVKTLKDINLELIKDETGKTSIENAIIKAKECYEKTGKPSMGMDDSLYLEGVPDDIQPGLYVRRVNGKTLTDDEMLEYYTNLVKKYGKNDKLPGKWVYGLAVINESGELKTYTWEKADFYMTSERSSIVNPGYPLNTITKYTKIDKFFTDVTKEELELLKQDETHVVEFICDALGVK